MNKLVIAIMCWGVILLSCAAAGAAVIHHDLEVAIEPDDHRLTGSDHIQVQPQGSRALIFDLAQQATDLQVFVDGRPAPFRFENARLRVDLRLAQRQRALTITVKYVVIFNDPAPVRPINTDNPGYGVTGTIQPQGTFLLAGSGWYPHLDAATSFRLRVTAPAGVVAVTAGRSLGHATRNGQTVSTWQIEHPVRGLALSAAHYRVRERHWGNIVAATYFLPENDHLAESYLTATIGHLQRYEALFGPYPFSKFAIVENFFPTGFGFASYTLIGGRVLRLPFIPRTSLGHEIAHCWWGNGVQVDYAEGNWSEALTTYCADYLYKEEASSEEGRAHRLQMLRNYASLVSKHDDLPLNRFRNRYSPATRAIGYDKGAMVFHMLRQLLGEDAFWGTLRDVYRDHLFTPITWHTFQKAFEQRSQRNLDTFFKQWLTRMGAPQVTLEGLAATRRGREWEVTGKVVQTAPFYEIDAEIALECPGSVQKNKIRLSGPETSFTLRSPLAPEKLVLDPDVAVFRKLAVAEIPPSINSIKGARDVVVVLADGLDPAVEKASQTLITGLGVDIDRIVREGQADAALLKAHDLILIGYNGDVALGTEAGDLVIFEPNGYIIDGEPYGAPEDVFFGVFVHPLAPQRVVALFWPLTPSYAETAARKITHYGKYSYLVFRRGQNRVKGVWPAIDSPLIHRWSDKTTSRDDHPTGSAIKK